MVLKKRKQSTTRLGDDIAIADYGADENITDNAKIQWVNQPWVRKLLRGAAMVSFISLCFNTPKTFEKIPSMEYMTLVVDSVVTLLFFSETIFKMTTRGIIFGEYAYLRDNWGRFDTSMVLSLWVSILLQICQIANVVPKYTPYTILRAPRPFIMIRSFRVYLKFKLPKARVKSIFKRSGQQVWSVTIFLVFFLVLYGMLGVQMFGDLSTHCVKKEIDNQTFSAVDFDVNYLAIPDTHCNLEKEKGEQCPYGMVCRIISLTPAVKGYNSFQHIGVSIFTVYESASLEGWVFIMYKVTDSFPSWRGYFFFITMIFFLAWLVKNVFIAVIIETFAEIRVQFRQMWTRGGAAQSFDSKVEVLQDDGTYTPWKLTIVDENNSRGPAPMCCQRVLESRSCHFFILGMVAIDAVLASTYNMFYPDNEDLKNRYHKGLYIAQVGFTLLFDVEVLFKVWCLGFRGYFKRSLHKFELCLAIGNSIRIMDPERLYSSQLAYFQVMRCFRLIKLSPTLEDFSRKIFGPFIKLGTLILFTMSSLILVSVISLQLFCYVEDLKQFDTFPTAFMSMFQILTQKGWAIVMYECMLAADNNALAPVIAIYFIAYHLFATVIVLSLFVAVILDNLELGEDFKGMKQMKASEKNTAAKVLPRRLRVFQKFPDKPQMVMLSKIPSEFTLPKIRDSFIRQFVETGTDMERLLKRSANRESSGTLLALALPPATYACPTSPLYLMSRRLPAFTTQIQGKLQKKTGVNCIVRDSAHQRVVSLGFSAVGVRGRMLSEYGSRDRRLRALRGSIRGHKPMESIKDNSDIANRNVSFNIKVIQERKQQAVQKRNAKEEDLRENHPYFDMPLFAVGRESKLRKFCTGIVYARYNATHTDESGMVIKRRYQEIHDFVAMVTYMTWCSIVVTTATCISMMYESPVNRVMDNKVLVIAEYIFVIFMGSEMILKILADGLFFTPKALIRDVGGFLDVFIYLISVIFLFWMPKNVQPASLAHVFLVLRCCRPLRIFALVPHLRKLFYELLRSFKEIFLVSVLLLALIFVFASYGVQIFATRLAKCNDPNITEERDCVGEFRIMVSVVKTHKPRSPEDELPTFLVPRVWANPRNFNFDNLGNALLALFEVLSLEGWLEVRDIIINQTNMWHTLYIHIFVFIGCMIGLTLFVGVVISNYFENKGTTLLTIDQRRWQDLKGRLQLAQPLHLPPRPDRSRFRAKLYDLSQHKYFKRFIAFLVLVNFFLLSSKWEDDETATVLAYISVVLTLMFVLEVILKCISLSPIGYWHSRRNRYDLLVTLMGVAWLILHFTNMNNTSFAFGAATVLFRFFTITGKHPTLKMLMMTIVVSCGKSFFIIVGLFLLITFYAFLGVVLFGKVKYGEHLGRHANFENAPNAMATLFRIVTGEDWNKIMHDCMISEPHCSKRGENYWETDCGNSIASMVYFCSFYVLIAYIVINLLVGIIMENFSLFYSNEEDALLSYADIKNFQITWNMVDIHRKGVIPVSRVKFVLRLLRGRLEVDMEKDHLLYKHMCCEIEKMRNGQDVTFHDVLSMLSYRSVDIRKSLQLDELLAREELEYNIEEEVAKETIRNWLDKCLIRMRAVSNAWKEKSHHPSYSNPFYGGEKPERLVVPPAFITTPSPPKEDTNKSKEETPVLDNIAPNPETNKDSTKKKLAFSPNAQTKSEHGAPSSPGHKLLVPTLSEGNVKPDGEDSASLRPRRSNRRYQTGSTSSSTSVTPVSSTCSAPVYPRSTSAPTATKEVQDWWKEQLHYDSGSEED
ncbi:sodium leak channel non-selective protein isoform X1 [Strongylocentrotus purpuratus]|uniref:Ion transport domain-containing protein n=1 Tax=Strongylocentrotus purpuratus TaxID=7668 RepID=A0A7M7NPU0_STRPU|nr:sodium leak channel non-selective protein isoform X1 [Strongylocentrotus purpuratus]